MFDIGEKVIYTTDDYVEIREPMCSSKRYIKVIGTVMDSIYVPEYFWNDKSLIPAHTIYTIKCDNGDIHEGWDWRLQKLQKGLDISA